VSGDRPSDLRIIGVLAANPAWVESISLEMRATLARKLKDALERCRKPREVASMVKAIMMLEQADVAKARLLLDAQRVQGPGDEQMDAMREMLDLVYQSRPVQPAGEGGDAGSG
jgi:hypothetical protein